MTNDPTVGWRNGATFLGADGYAFGETYDVLPSYVTSATVSGAHNQSDGLIDNPSDPSGADTIVANWAGSSSSGVTLSTIVFQGATATLRLGVLYDSANDSFGLSTQTLTLTQTVGGSATATTSTLTMAYDGLDVAYFDLAGIQDGDTFTLHATKGTVSWGNMSGVTFDTVPEPSSTALLGLGGLALILRRRK